MRNRLIESLVLSGLIVLPAAAGADVQTVSLSANSIIWDPVSQRIYASTPSSAGAMLGNRIVRMNPATAMIEDSAFVGSEPGPLARSLDGQFIYAGLDGSAMVRQYDIATNTAGLEFALGSDSFFGPMFAEDIAVSPVDPETIAVSRRYQGVSPRHAGVAIYVNGVQLPNATPDHTGSNRIEWSDLPNVIYGYNNETTEFGFRRMTTGETGVAITNTVGNLISGFGVDIEHAGGRVYSNTGRVVNGEALTLAGTYTGPGFGFAVQPDPDTGRTYFATGSGSTATISAYDHDKFIFIDSIPVPGLSGGPADLIRWGSTGLAFRAGNQIVIVVTELVPDVNPADLNDDGEVNAADLALLLGAWGANPGHAADLNDDDSVNAADLALLLGAWTS